jgi:hypothetical protein
MALVIEHKKSPKLIALVIQVLVCKIYSFIIKKKPIEKWSYN